MLPVFINFAIGFKIRYTTVNTIKRFKKPLNSLKLIAEFSKNISNLVERFLNLCSSSDFSFITFSLLLIYSPMFSFKFEPELSILFFKIYDEFSESK